MKFETGQKLRLVGKQCCERLHGPLYSDEA